MKTLSYGFQHGRAGGLLRHARGSLNEAAKIPTLTPLQLQLLHNVTSDLSYLCNILDEARMDEAGLVVVLHA
jgi:ribosomal protein L10